MEYSSLHGTPNGSVPPAAAPTSATEVPQGSSSAAPAAAEPLAAQPSAGDVLPAAPLEPTASTSCTIIYPPESKPNPAYSLGGKRQDPILGELERPERLPRELDERVDPSSVWMIPIPATGEAAYFLPGGCTLCRSLQTHCNRSEPACGNCRDRKQPCTLGNLVNFRTTATAVHPVPQKAPAPERRPSAVDKGKSKAVEDESDESEPEAEIEEGGRGKRVKKKRRLSASDELDPNLLNWDGTGLKKQRARAARPSVLPPASSGPSRPEDIDPTPDDRRYQAAVTVNDERPALHEMRGFCPVWADRRRALFAAAEYLRNPQRTVGASVNIGASGVARGVILEGVPPSSGTFWGDGAQAGTIVASIGKPRKPNAPAVPETMLASPSIADEFTRAWTGTADETTTNGAVNGTTPVPVEAVPIEALFMAQRARTPVAVGVGHDYPDVPFQVPRPVIVLGWFWVVDAWTEPVSAFSEEAGAPDSVVWKFRFEWCTEGQKAPWWTPKNISDRIPTPTLPDGTTSWPVRGPGVSGPTTLRGAAEPHPTPAPAEGEEDAEEPEVIPAVLCQTCNTYSDRVYEDSAPCLNEACSDYFVDTEDRARPIESNYPASARAEPRIQPEALRLSLAPEDPAVVYSEARRHDAQRDFWRAWVCKRCRMANERRDWVGFLCEACSSLEVPQRKVYSEDALRPASRTVCVGPRPDEGYPQWPFDAPRTTALFPDDVKVVRHMLNAGFAGGELHHVLGHEGKDVPVMAQAVLKGLQLQGPDEVPFRRHMLSASSSRVAELAVSPFYTIACGPDAPLIAHLPVGNTVEWTSSPQVCRDAMELINERAGRVYPGQAEFNSLLVAALPPSGVHPTIPVPRDSIAAFLILGSDATIRLKRVRGKIGEITAQHGDVIILKTGADGADVEVKPDGFGFVCLGRRVETDVVVRPAEQWYIGRWPVDPTLALRPHPALRPQPTIARDDDSPLDTTRLLNPQPFRGQVITRDDGPVSVHDPPPSAPLPGTEKKRTRRASGRASAERAASAVAAAAADETDSEAEGSTPRGKRGRGRGTGRGRARGVGRGRGRGRGGAAAATAAEASPASTASPSTTRGRGRGRGRARGRGRGRGGRAVKDELTPAYIEDDDDDGADDAVTVVKAEIVDVAPEGDVDME